jgi:hypothetical protein
MKLSCSQAASQLTHSANELQENVLETSSSFHPSLNPLLQSLWKVDLLSNAEAP